MNLTIRANDNALLQNLQRTNMGHQNTYATQQERIATGKKYLKRSENPSDTSEIASVKNEMKKSEQWRKNAELADSFEKGTQYRQDSMISSMQRVRELTVQANNDMLDETALGAISSEIDGIIEDLALQVNAKHLGVFVFGGTKTDTEPFTLTRDPVTNQITAANYVGSTTQRNIQVSKSSTTNPYGITGDKLIEFNGTDYFTELITLRDTLEAGNSPTPTSFGNMEDGLEHIIEKSVDNSGAQLKWEKFISNSNKSDLSGVERLGQIESLDMAEAISNLSSMEQSFQASMQMLGRMNKMSLVNFI